MLAELLVKKMMFGIFFLPKRHLSKDIFPSGNFPNVPFPNVLDSALGPKLGKLPLGKPPLGWENAFGKCRTHKKIEFPGVANVLIPLFYFVHIFIYEIRSKYFVYPVIYFNPKNSFILPQFSN